MPGYSVRMFTLNVSASIIDTRKVFGMAFEPTDLKISSAIHVSCLQGVYCVYQRLLIECLVSVNTSSVKKSGT